MIKKNLAHARGFLATIGHPANEQYHQHIPPRFGKAHEHSRCPRTRQCLLVGFLAFIFFRLLRENPTEQIRAAFFHADFTHSFRESQSGALRCAGY
jgi:hypothetical protein